ncbi:hypothetical protein CAter282_2156 [Collimonas arenae]|uniref:Uncharacterized protein n=1 Tax=Collimonas arenae TaxID=279058 RepID=A0A127QK13_9BURK|nr:hypothetical protein CAter10_2350 [Collimonas arenae]AMP09912.1 hypothetical protein CAter282_2156 [Collimonas arenae]
MAALAMRQAVLLHSCRSDNDKKRHSISELLQKDIPLDNIV